MPTQIEDPIRALERRIRRITRRIKRIHREIRRGVPAARRSRMRDRVTELRERRRELRDKLADLKEGEEPEEVPPEDDDVEQPDPDEPEPDEEEEEPEPPEPPDAPAFDPNQDVRVALRQLLNDWGLPQSLMSFIEQMMAEGRAQTEIVTLLRQTPEYNAAYPENSLRLANGHDWWPEERIRAYRAEAKRIVESRLGMSVSDSEVAGLVARNVSLQEWERRLQTWKDFERYGPVVRSVLEQELGHRIPDDRVYAFMSTDIPTPAEDAAYERALLRGQPALIGLGVRPEDEAELLRRYGINPDQAFRGYQNLARELPQQQRLAMIESEIGRNVDQFPGGNQVFAGTPFSLLFRAIQLADADAIRELQSRMAREVARFQAGGGAARQGTQAVGLLTPEERQQRGL